MNFQDKVILITGASSEIGAHAAEGFARFNGKVALVDRNEERLKEVAKNCAKESNDEKTKPLVIVEDGTEDAEKIIKKVIDHFGKLDVLINGVNELMETNVYAGYEMTKHAVPYLIKTEGNIVNLIPSNENMIGYSMSTAALVEFTRRMSWELANKNVRVNSVNLDTVKPDMLVGDMVQNPESVLQAIERCMPEKGDEPFYVAHIILFLAYNVLSNFITGVTVPVDGGRNNHVHVKNL